MLSSLLKKGTDGRSVIYDITKSYTINLLENSVLDDK